MATKPKVDVMAAHKYFSAHCFNTAWDLIEKPNRTDEDNRLMVALNQAAIYHWINRDDCDNKRLSVGYWQAARIQALIGNFEEARRHAEVSLSYSAGLEPFYGGYAYEALARTEALAGKKGKAHEYLNEASAYAAGIKKKDEQEMLLKDLASIAELTDA